MKRYEQYVKSCARYFLSISDVRFLEKQEEQRLSAQRLQLEETHPAQNRRSEQNRDKCFLCRLLAFFRRA